MSEELNEGQVAEPTAPESNPVEEQARAQGWVPKEEWQGEGRWRDAEAFLDRGELFSKIDAQRRENRELRKNQEAFATHLKTVREAEFKRALATIRAEKKQALIDGDPDKVVDADEKMLLLSQEQAKLSQVDHAPQVNNEDAQAQFQAWQSTNTWYTESNRAMKAFADVEGVRFAQANPHLTPAEVLKEVTAQVRKEFPEKFTNPNRSKPGAVEAGAGKGGAQRDTYQLNDHERNVMNRLVKSGVMTKEEYIRDLKAKG